MSSPSTTVGTCGGPTSLDRRSHGGQAMSGTFAGKTVAITGAAGGIGQWLCSFFGEEGATIAALDRSDKVLALPEALGKDGISVKAAVVDIADAQAVQRAFDGFGDVHILINNAGVSRHPTLAVTDPAGGRQISPPTSMAPMPAPTRCCRRWSSAGPATSSLSARSTASLRWAILPTAPPRPA